MGRNDWSSEKLFSRLLEHKTRKTYWATINELRRRPNKKVFDYGMKLAKSKIDKEKIIGIDVLAQLGLNPRYDQQNVIDLYFSLLNVPQTPKVLSALLSGIGHNNADLSRQHLEKLAEFKNHRFSDVRFNLVFALSGIEHEFAINQLIELSSDRHSDIRDWATFSIGSQVEMSTPSIVAALRSRLNDSDDDTRSEAISGLAKRKDIGIKKILIEALENTDDHGPLILESIEEFGDPSFIPLLKEQIQKNKKLRRFDEQRLLDTLETLKKHV